MRILPARVLSKAITVATLSLTVTGALRAQTTWTANSSTDFNWNTTANWSLNALPLATDDVVFPSPIPNPASLSNPGTIALGTGEVANSLTLNEAYTLTGGGLALTSGNITVGTGITAGISTALAGTSGLTKAGPGTLTLSGTNTYTGGTIIASNGGTLQITTTVNALQGAATINTGGTLHLNVASATDITFANTITGAGTLRITAPGTGSVTNSLSGDLSAFTGTIDIFPSAGGGGKLRLIGATQATVPSSSATIKIESGGTLYLPNPLNYGSSVQLFGGTTGETLGQLRMESGAIVSGSVTLMANSTIGSNAGTGTISGALGESGGSFGFTKQGAGTIALSSASNSYTGATSIAAGTLSLTGGANRLPTTTTVNFTGASTLDLGSNAQSVAGLSVSQGVTATLANGTLTTGSGTITFLGNTGSTSTLTGGTIQINGGAIDASSAGTVSGITRNVASTISGTGGLTISAFGDTSDSGGGNSSLFNLTGTNTFTGNVTINSGLVRAGADAAFGDTANQIVINGGGLIASVSLALPATRSISLAGTGDRFFRVYGGQTLTINGVVGGSGSLRKTDGGTLTLAGANTYTGSTTIGGGTITLSGGANRLPTTTAVNFTGAGTLNLGGNAQTVSGLSVAQGITGTISNGMLGVSGGTISFPGNTAGTSTLSAPALSISGITIDASSGGTVTGITRNVSVPITGTGGLTLAGLGDTNDSGGGNSSLLNLNNANSFTGGVTITTGFVNPVLDGAFGDSSNSITISGGGIVSNRGITLPSTRSIVLAGSGDRFVRAYTGQTVNINGNISGTGGLRKTDSGALTLAGTNTYSGATTVGAGTVLLAREASLYNGVTSSWTDTNIVVNSGATLALRVGGAGEFTSADLQALSGLGTATGGFKSGAVLGLDTTNAVGGVFTHTAAINNPNGGTNVLSVNKLGVNTLTLTGANAYTGATTISRGTLSVTGSVNGTTGTALTFGGTGTFNANEAAGAAQGMGALTFSGGDGAVQSTYGGSGNTSLTFSSLATRAVGATGNFVVTNGTNGTTNKIVLTGVTPNAFINQGTFFGGNAYAWNDAGGFVRAISYSGTPDTGTTQVTASTASATGTHVQVTGAGAITAQTTATFSTLNLDNANNFVLAASNTLTIDGILKSGNAAGGTVSGGTGIQASSGGELVVRTDGASDTLSISAPILNNNSSSLTKSGAGTLNLSGANTYAGGTRIAAGTLNVTAPSATNILGAGPVSVADGATLSINSGNNAITYANTFTGTGTVNVATSNNNGLALTGGNWSGFNGTINVNTTSGGKLAPGTVTFGSGATINLANGASFFSSGVVTFTNAFTATGTGNNENRGTFRLAGGATIAGPIALLGNITIGSDNTGMISGVISGSGSVSTASTSAGAFTLAGANTYTGNTTITSASSTLRLGNSGVIPDGAGKGDVSVTGTLDLNSFSETINGLSGAGTIDTIIGGTPTLTVGNNNGGGTFSGVIKNTLGSLSLTKIGNGTLTLSGANTYTGTTTVSGGTLLVNGNIAGTVLVSGGTLGGTGGTVGATTVNSGGAIAPGSSIGTLNTGALSLNGTAQFKLELNTTSATTDLANVLGNLTLDLGNSVSLTLADLGSNAALPLNTTLTFIDYSGTWNGGTFAGLPDDSTFTFGANQFQISYNGVSGTDTAVTLTVVPEPGSLISLAGGVGLLLGLRRRKR